MSTVNFNKIPAPALNYGPGEACVERYSFGNLSGNDIYGAIYPNVNSFDALQGITQITAGSNIENVTGVAGYVRNDAVSPSNGVALFGCAMAAGTGSCVWGINTLLQDSATRTAGSATGRRLTNELDFNVMNPGTQVIGLSIGGNSLAQPSAANGYIVNTLGAGIKWTTGFFSMDGTAVNGLAIGAMEASGANIGSQNVIFSYFDNLAAKRAIYANAIGGFFILSSPTAWNGLKVSAGNVLVDAGYGFIVNGAGVVGGRKTGWNGAANGGKAYFDAATATPAQTASAVAALIADLTAHGLIGA